MIIVLFEVNILVRYGNANARKQTDCVKTNILPVPYVLAKWHSGPSFANLFPSLVASTQKERRLL